jgi:hypothetical protein
VKGVIELGAASCGETSKSGLTLALRSDMSLFRALVISLASKPG